MTITPGLVSRGLLHVQQDVVPAQLFRTTFAKIECDRSAGCRSAIIAEGMRGWEKRGKWESEIMKSAGGRL